MVRLNRQRMPIRKCPRAWLYFSLKAIAATFWPEAGNSGSGSDMLIASNVYLASWEGGWIAAFVKLVPAIFRD